PTHTRSSAVERSADNRQAGGSSPPGCTNREYSRGVQVMTILNRKPGRRDAAVSHKNVDPERKAPEERRGTFNPVATGSTPPRFTILLRAFAPRRTFARFPRSGMPFEL